MKSSPSRSTTTPKRDKIQPKSRNLLVHIAELSYTSSRSCYKSY